MKILGLLILSFCFLPILQAQDSKEVALIEEYFRIINKIDPEEDNPMFRAALFFRDTPYAGGTLEINKEEQLIINLSQFDCTTYIETALALARAGKKENPSYEDFLDELQRIRYRGGEIDGYTSRLHYISEWIMNNEDKGIVVDITCDLDGEEFLPEVDYMSTHPQLYKALQNNPEAVNEMEQIEQYINEESYLCYIPCGEIDSVSPDIEDGDIIFFTTSIAGLDVQHAGIALWNEGYLSFIHASSKAQKVIIEPQTITSYCNKQKTITGIIVVRPVF